MTLPLEVAERISPDTTALLVIDVQRRHLDVDGVGYHTLPDERATLVTVNVGKAMTMARAAGIPVVHVGTWEKPGASRAGHPSGNPFMKWQTGKPITGRDFPRQSGVCTEGSVYAE